MFFVIPDPIGNPGKFNAGFPLLAWAKRSGEAWSRE